MHAVVQRWSEPSRMPCALPRSTARGVDRRRRVPSAAAGGVTAACASARPARGTLVSVHTRTPAAEGAPVGAAVFRRGDAVWIVFDTAARMDMTGAKALGPGGRAPPPRPPGSRAWAQGPRGGRAWAGPL